MAVRPKTPPAALVAEVGRRMGGASQVTTESVEAVLRDVLAERELPLRPEARRSTAVAIADELAGFGPIGPLLRDASVTEVMI